ncbi:unnamed protein product [Tetraodon nigroviridis]|uniref:(spotted green pufferfish) hypothetical protein n=1 Tax=Tetraodon nigroviridis TaxID=99883 RepID=Q4S5S3_TETNG|nr:unnamed protein product [Tetraodon nigroviridis]
MFCYSVLDFLNEIMNELTVAIVVLYDGLCPVCVAEIRFLQFLQRRRPGRLDFVDISLPGYDGAKHRNVTYEMAMEAMHVIDEKGQVHRGVPAFAVMSCEDTRADHLKFSFQGRDTVKAEAPVGTMEEAESNLTAVGGRLGQSFSRLSAHINFYFRRKDIAPVVVTPVDQGRSVTRARKLPRKDKDEREIAETASSAQGKPDLQLFHVSSLATAFGESYSYVANHINATFSRQFSQIPVEKKVEEVPLPSRTPRKLKRRKQQHSLANSEGLKRGQVKSDANQGTNRPSSSWEEGYRQFARHINRYFGAKVADEPGQPSERRPDATSQQNQKEAVAAPPQGLFHHSRHATDFGENYFQTASHINQYFKGATEEDLDGGLTETASGSFTLKRSVSFMDCLRHPTSAIPDLLGAFFSTSPLTQAGEQQPAVTPTQTAAKKQLVLSHREVEDVTRGLIGRLSQASSPDVLTACLEALNEHLVCHPACKAITWQVGRGQSYVRV